MLNENENISLPPLNRGETVILAAAVFLCLVVRLVNVPHVIDKQGPVLFDPDSCYHLYIIKQTMAHYPRVPSFDPGLVYPTGLDNPWPPLLDLTAATAAMPLRILVDQRTAEKALVFFMPLLTSLAVIPLFFLLRRYNSRSLTFSAISFYIVLSPPLVGMAGFLDHDAAMIPFHFLVALAFLQALKTGRPWWLGIAAAGQMLCWSGSAIYLVPLGLACLWLHVRGKGEGRLPAAGLGIILAAALYFSGLLLWQPRKLWEAHYVFPGIYQAEQLLVFGAGLLMLRGKRSRALELFLAAGALIIGLLALPGMWSRTMEGLQYLGRHEDWLRSLTEHRPLIFSGQLPLRTELVSLMGWTGMLLFLLPLSLILWLRRQRGVLDIYLTAGLLVNLFLAMRQVRYLPQLMPWLAVSGAWLVSSLAARFSGKKNALAAISLTVLLLLPGAKAVSDYHKIGGPSYNRQAVMAARWLNRYAGEHQARGGVMVASYYGFAFRCYAELPVVTDGFVVESRSEGLLDTARFYAAESPDAALKILDQHRVRYVVVIQPEYELDHDAAVLGIKPGVLFKYLDNPEGPGFISLLDPAFRTMAARLYYRQWNRNNLGPPEKLRLIYPPSAEKINVLNFPIPFSIYEYNP